MKKLILPLIIILMAAMLFGCSGNGGTPVSAASNKKVDGPDAFKEHSIVLDAPAEAEKPTYYLYTEEDGESEVFIAEVDYTYAGSAYTLKCANIKNKNISGVAESGEPEVFDLSVGNFSSQLRIYKTDKISLALWSLGNYSYSLTSKDSESFEIAAIDAAQSNEPASTAGADITTAPQTDEFEEQTKESYDEDYGY